MKSFEIQGKVRTEVGKKTTKKLRKEGFIPCELYGGKDNLHFYTEGRLFEKLVYTPNTYLIQIDMEGNKRVAIIQDIQFHPVTDEVLHVDFVEVFDDKKVVIKIPVVVTGNSIGIRNGGKLRLVRRALKVSGLSKDLPDNLEIDITKLEIGDTIKIKDLNFDNIELIGPQNAMVVGVVSSRISKSMMAEEEGEGEEGAEGEGTPAEGGEAPAEAAADAPAEGSEG